MPNAEHFDSLFTVEHILSLGHLDETDLNTLLEGMAYVIWEKARLISVDSMYPTNCA